MANSKLKDYIIVFLMILSAGFFASTKYYANQRAQTLLVYADSLHYYKNKINEEYVAKDIYISSVKDLKKQNLDLYNEIKYLKDNPIIITKTEVVVKMDTIVMNSDSIYHNSDDTHKLVWSNDNQFYNIKGNTIVKNDFSEFITTVDRLQMNTSIMIDLIEHDKKLKVIAKSSNPYITITDMDGAFIDPNKSKAIKSCIRKKKFSIGPTLGYGITSDFELKPYFGLGITYGVIQF